MDWLRLESPAYWITFVATFLLVAMLESARPHRENMIPTERRWTMHGLLLLFLMVLNTAIFQTSPVAVAILAQGNPWGVLGFAAIPFPIRFAAAFLLLDFTKYVTHWLYHHVPFLWPIHRVHHSDPDFDVSTGARFHPLEPILVQAADFGLILLLAPPPSAVLFAKLAGVASNYWEHANATLPPALERALRIWIVTPELHRIHHSQGIVEQNRNLGEVLPWWDRLLGTYQGQSDPAMEVGLAGYGDARSIQLKEMLTQPFQRQRPAR
jgi:sterol desaturase/sphingolipid hydroxylase (fatty acid hydroxylase superfamily)